MIRLTFFALALATLCSCGEPRADIDRRERAREAWKACVDQGGVPIQSWFSADVLGDCKFRDKI